MSDGYLPSAHAAVVGAREKMEQLTGPLQAASEMCTEALALLRTAGEVPMTGNAAGAVNQVETQLVEAFNSARLAIQYCNDLAGLLMAGPPGA